MEQDQLLYLLALQRTQDWALAALSCQTSEAELRRGVQAAERACGQTLVQPGEADKAGAAFQGFTTQGEAIVAQAQVFSDAVASLRLCFQSSKKRAAMQPLLARRSVSPKRLGLPGPDAADIRLMTEAALSAPDHGGLHPWRLLAFEGPQRQALADLFEQEKRRRDPLAPPEDLRRAREHATASPALLAFIVSPQARMRVPQREQVLAAGAALGNFLNAAHQLGFGAIILSGERCFDPALCAALGLGPDEQLAGFISVGSIVSTPAQRKPTPVDEVLSSWSPIAVTTPAPSLR